MENALWTPRSRKKERQKVFQALKQRFPCSPKGVDLGGAAVPLQPMEVWRGAEIYLRPLEDLMPLHMES